MSSQPLWTSPFSIVDLIGVLANAMLAGVIARHEKFDPIGTAVLAMLSGLGGGVFRDMILQSGPPAAFGTYTYIVTALAGGTVGYLMKPTTQAWRLTWPFVDAVALGAWAAAGALKAVLEGLTWLPAIVIGTISAIGGGMVRDIVIRRTPTVLGGNTLYASCAVIAAATSVGFHDVRLDTTGLAVATVIGATLCLVARWRGWILPSRDGWTRRKAQQRPAYAHSEQT